MKTKLPERSKIIDEIIANFKKRVSDYYGIRLHSLVLYGSCARGDFREGSDIDILVVLDLIESEMNEIANLTEIKTDLILEYERYLSINPVSREKFENSVLSFYQHVKEEGILLWTMKLH